MQIVESSALGVRAAIYRLGRAEGELEFELFPMLHIAEPGFYDAVRARLDACDLVLFEGVASRRASALRLSYSLIAKRKRLGLVCQSDALPLGALSAKRIHADLSTPEFDTHWRRVPRLDRLAVSVIALARGLWGYLTATRGSLVGAAGTDDLTSRDDALFAEQLPELNDALLTHRDGHLLACVLRCHESHARERKRVGVLYGAAHIRPVVRLLQDRLGYRVKGADWLTVFEL